jgi:hypothetical protein
LKNYAFAEENNIKREQLLGKDIMMIGYPQNKALLRHLPDQIAIAPESFVLNEKSHRIRRKTWPVRSPITANTVTWHLKTGKIGPKDFGR